MRNLLIEYVIMCIQPLINAAHRSAGFIDTKLTSGFGATKTPAEGTVAIKHCLFDELGGNGWYADSYRDPVPPSHRTTSILTECVRQYGKPLCKTGVLTFAVCGAGTTGLTACAARTTSCATLASTTRHLHPCTTPCTTSSARTNRPCCCRVLPCYNFCRVTRSAYRQLLATLDRAYP